MKWKPDWFLIGMFVAVGLAWLLPDPGAKGGVLHPEIVTKAGVALIFFLHGAALSFANLKTGTLRWPLHLVVQSCTYILFPLLGLAMLPLLKNWLPPDLQLGFFFLCALPSTVSSSVAMTAAAKGNVPAAVFNATLSSLIGVVITPLWMGLILKTAGQSLPVGKVILDLMFWLVLPFFVGHFSRPLTAAWIERNKKVVQIADRGTILLLVYTSFCDSVKWGVWSGHKPGVLTATFVGSFVIFWVVLFLVGSVCDRLHFSHADRSAAVFCGSKKSLATGVPMAQLMFANTPGLSLILLPIMIYHPLQLILCGWLAERWARSAPPPK